MKLYYSKGACSLAIRILLHELNLPFEEEAVDLKTKMTKGGENYLTINLKGAVPALLLDNGKVLTENAVIHQYLAEANHATQLLPNPDDFQRYRVLEWLTFITTDIHKGFGPLFNPQVDQNMKDSIFIPLLIKKFLLTDNALAIHPFIAGDHYTLPDGYLFVMLFWLRKFNIDVKQWEHLGPYYTKMLARPAIQKALGDEGLG